MEEKTKRTGIQALAVLLVAGLLVFYGIPQLTKEQAVTVGTCYDGIKNCHDGACEEGKDCGGVCPPCASAPPATGDVAPAEGGTEPEPEEAILCPGTLETKMLTAVYDSLSEDAFDQLKVKYKAFDAETGKYLRIAGLTSTSADVTEYVPCGKRLKVIYHLDNGSTSDIYPVSEYIFPTGSQIPTSAEAKVQGSIKTVIWDTTGTESDNNITMGKGQTYTFLKLKVQENSSDAAAQDLVELVDYNTSAFQSITVVGATKLPGVPTVFNTYDVAYDLGVSLDTYDSAVYDVVIKALTGVNPGHVGSEENITFKTVDKCGYFAQDQATFISPIPGSIVGLQSDLNADVGITGAKQGTAILHVE
ncbi:hypothetical protein DRQ25_00345 [Candidatus Fermentibacteria bacterium]|nr:MAG: hypothetical protein DRQ25_00345 [Candidatus Fermentibacteria bacterium]